MKELSQTKLLSYDSTLNMLTLHGFNGAFPISSDGLYYFRKDTDRLQGLSGLYLKLKPIRFYYATNQGIKWVVYSVENLQEINPKSIIFATFKIIGTYYSLEKLNSKSKLKGFSRVIDDNEYFSKIPLINQLTHFDNGILYSSGYILETSYDQERQAYPVNFPDHVIIRELQKNWDKFKLSFYVNEREKPIIKMTGGKGHEKL